MSVQWIQARKCIWTIAHKNKSSTDKFTCCWRKKESKRARGRERDKGKRKWYINSKIRTTIIASETTSNKSNRRFSSQFNIYYDFCFVHSVAMLQINSSSFETIFICSRNKSFIFPIGCCTSTHMHSLFFIILLLVFFFFFVFLSASDGIPFVWNSFGCKMAIVCVSL